MSLTITESKPEVKNSNYQKKPIPFERQTKWAQRDYSEMESILLIIAREHGLSDRMFSTLAALISFAGTRVKFNCSYKMLYKKLRDEINEETILDDSKITNIYRRIDALKKKQKQIGITYFTHKTPTEEERKQGISSEFNIQPIANLMAQILKEARENTNYSSNPGKTVTATASRIAREIYQTSKKEEQPGKKPPTIETKISNATRNLLNLTGAYANGIDKNDPDAVLEYKMKMESTISSLTDHYATTLTTIFHEKIEEVKAIEEDTEEADEESLDNSVYGNSDQEEDYNQSQIQNVYHNKEVSHIDDGHTHTHPDEILSFATEVIEEAVQDIEQHFTISNFSRKQDNSPKHQTITWKQFCKKLEQPIIRRDKDGRAFCTSLFEGTRAIENVVSVSMIGIDIDKGLSFDEALEATKQLNCCFAMYSTYSHSSKQDKFRIIIPLKRVVFPHEFVLLWKVIADKCYGKKNDTSCSDASRMWCAGLKDRRRRWGISN